MCVFIEAERCGENRFVTIYFKLKRSGASNVGIEVAEANYGI